MLHAVKADKTLDPMTVGLFGFISHIPAADQRTEPIHEAGRVIRQFGWDVQDHSLSLHAVYLYSTVGLTLRKFTQKSGDIRQLSQNSVNFSLSGLQPYENYGIVNKDWPKISVRMLLEKFNN